ncbi:MAG: hypothetical protein JW913_20410 [Chitinispirillaceae bacterium]|nr:hypothetical protein [Chitinispirillaceae bacterium]
MKRIAVWIMAMVTALALRCGISPYAGGGTTDTGNAKATAVVRRMPGYLLPVLVLPDDIFDLLLHFRFVEHLFEIVGDFFTPHENIGPFFEQREFKLPLAVFFAAQAQLKDTVTDGDPQNKNKSLYKNKQNEA